MLLLLSPAKKLDYDTPVRSTLHTQPLFVQEAAELIKVLRGKSADEIASLMKLSTALAELNVGRYAEWAPSFDTQNARQAILAFNGDVYEGLRAAELSDN
ncbi:MAG: YaaA family protein, partial [Burkholderiaceae bacterium]